MSQIALRTNFYLRESSTSCLLRLLGRGNRSKNRSEMIHIDGKNQTINSLENLLEPDRVCGGGIPKQIRLAGLKRFRLLKGLAVHGHSKDIKQARFLCREFLNPLALDLSIGFYLISFSVRDFKR